MFPGSKYLLDFINIDSEKQVFQITLLEILFNVAYNIMVKGFRTPIHIRNLSRP